VVSAILLVKGVKPISCDCCALTPQDVLAVRALSNSAARHRTPIWRKVPCPRSTALTRNGMVTTDRFFIADIRKTPGMRPLI
jgi:hypothetical protein